MISWRTLFFLSFLRNTLALSDECSAGLPPSVLAEVKSAEEQWKEELKCDSSIDGGRWLLFQQNILQKSALFTRGEWRNYAQGFHDNPDGGQEGIFWLGLDRLHRITTDNNAKKWQLLVKVRWYESIGGVKASTEGWAIWRDFRIDNEADKFKLNLGQMVKYSNIPSHPKPTDKLKMSEDGKIFDPFYIHHDMKFSTVDQDNDEGKDFSCAKSFRSGFWFNSCYNVNLNSDPPLWFDGTNVHFTHKTVMALRMMP